MLKIQKFLFVGMCLFITSGMSIAVDALAKPELVTAAVGAAKLGDADFPAPSPGARHDQKVAAVKNGQYDVVLIGDSITQCLEGGGEWEPLKATWDRHYGSRNGINLGYSGYRTENILWNLQNGELEFAQSPKVAILLIGTNNIDDQHYKSVHTAEQVFAGTKAIVDIIRQRHPTTKIIIRRPFPCGTIGDETPYGRKYNRSLEAWGELNDAGLLTARLADNKQVFWSDVSYVFMRPDGSLNSDLMPDLIHPNGPGAEAAAQALEPLLANLLNDKPIIDIPTDTNAARLTEVAAPFGDNMVLQREIDVPVWGTATPGTTITVEFGGQSKKTTTDTAGRWQVKLDPMAASAENRELTVSSGTTRITFKSVLVGEVWICSGQSNMAMGVMACEGAENVANAADPELRLRFVNKTISPLPLTSLNGSQWQQCSPQSLGQGIWAGFSAAGYSFGKELRSELKVPIGLIQSAWGGTRIEPWTPPSGFQMVDKLKDSADWLKKADVDYRNSVIGNIDALAIWEKNARMAITTESDLPSPPPAIVHSINNHGHPTAIYNSMINPLVPYAIRGAIWYQGESNRGEGMLYFEKMKALIGGWRTVWDQGDFPFYFVQLAPFNYGNTPEALPEMWEAQTEAAIKIPNTGMAIISDVGNVSDIHPRDKTTVGKRLARLALSRTYGIKVVDDCGPIFKSMTIDGGRIKVDFDYAKSGLATRDGKLPTCFEIAGGDDKFVAAQASIVGSSVVVSSEQVAVPTQIRFAWTHVAVSNLINGEKLPASAFRAPRKINFALNAPYTTPTPNPYNWGATGRLTDGSWIADAGHCFATNEADTFPKEVTVDLQGSQVLSRIVFGVPPFGSTKTVAVAISEDGKTFTDVGKHEFTQGKIENTQIRLNQIKARYIKLTCLDRYDKQVQYPIGFSFITELEAY